MPKHIATESGDLTIEIGTRDDDKRIAPDCLYLNPHFPDQPRGCVVIR